MAAAAGTRTPLGSYLMDHLSNLISDTWTRGHIPEPNRVLLLLASLACILASFLWSRRSPVVRCSFIELLHNYKPGKILELHHKYACRAYPRCWQIRVPGDPLILGTINPEVVDHVLVKNFKNWEKGPHWREAFRDLLGDGIFNADGYTWKKQRKVASYEFSASSLRDFMTTIFVRHAEEALRMIERRLDNGTATVDAQEVFAAYTLESIGQIGFGVAVGAFQGDAATSFGHAFNTATKLTGDRFVDPLWKAKRLLGVGSEARLRRALRGVRGFSERVIKERRRETREELAQRQDLLSRFMLCEEAPRGEGAGAEAGGRAGPGALGPAPRPAEMTFTDAELHFTTINFVLAGRDTTANLLTWTLYELARAPQVLARLRGQLSGEDPSYAATTHNHFLRATLTEVLRLHPSVPLDFKTAVEADTLPDGTRVAAGQRVMFVAWSMGRHAALWPDPHAFLPERHLDAEGRFQAPPPCKHPAFLAGPRVCLGKHTAYLAAGIMLIALLQRFDLDLTEPATRPVYDVGLTLWVHGDLPVRFRPRSLAGEKK